MDYTQLLDGIKVHPYVTIITATVVSGRITAVVVGAFVAKGYINPFIAYCIFVTMDILGDTLYHLFGRMGHLGGTFLIRKSWQKKLSRLNQRFGNNFTKMLFFVKVTGIGSKPTIVGTGIVKMPLPKFYSITAPCTLALFVLYMAVGYFFGQWIF